MTITHKGNKVPLNYSIAHTRMPRQDVQRWLEMIGCRSVTEQYICGYMNSTHHMLYICTTFLPSSSLIFLDNRTSHSDGSFGA